MSMNWKNATVELFNQAMSLKLEKDAARKFMIEQLATLKRGNGKPISMDEARACFNKHGKQLFEPVVATAPSGKPLSEIFPQQQAPAGIILLPTFGGPRKEATPVEAAPVETTPVVVDAAEAEPWMVTEIFPSGKIGRVISCATEEEAIEELASRNAHKAKNNTKADWKIERV